MKKNKMDKLYKKRMKRIKEYFYQPFFEERFSKDELKKVTDDIKREVTICGNDIMELVVKKLRTK